MSSRCRDGHSAMSLFVPILCLRAGLDSLLTLQPTIRWLSDPRKGLPLSRIFRSLEAVRMLRRPRMSVLRISSIAFVVFWIFL